MNINRDRLLALLGNDHERVERFITTFQANLPLLKQSIRTAFESEEWEAASIYCHDLKNQANYLDLPELAVIAYELEQLGERKEMPGVALLERL
ncbi:MAG: Hpt domain-containing protein [Bacteroidota bacterium]